MRFGSVCSGIEAASVAWHPLGWQAAWLSEIEPFPSAVLAHHYPDVPNLGDMTTLPERILSGEVEAPDLFCGGTPCQAFSVAGLRNSLDDARGNLSLTFVGIANAIDHVRSVRRDSPGIIFWENVPGVLSTKDNAFGCFLGALAGEDEPIIPSGEKWTNAGCVFGPQRTVAWRVLDAQYFGVAQRRRRVFVVASARADFDPAAVLFEFDGLRRDSAPSREAGQAIAPCVTNGPPFSRTGNERVEAEAMVLMDQGGSVMNVEHDMVGTLRRETHGHEPVVVAARMVAFGEYVNDGTASAMKARDYKDATDLVAQPSIVGSLCARTGLSMSVQDADQGHLLAQPTYGIPGNWIGRAPENGGNAVEPMHDISPCLTSADRHGVVQPIPINSMNALRGADADPTTGCGIGEAGEAMFTITKAHSHAVAQPIAFNIAPGKGELKDDIHVTDAHISKTIDASGSNPSMHQGGAAIVQAMAVGTDCFNGSITGDVAATMGTMGSSVNASGPTVMQSMQVRRLTPVECERLQGFPDGYTNIPWRKKPEAPDGPRYKALGNSWAVPVVAWIGNRIQQELNK